MGFSTSPAPAGVGFFADLDNLTPQLENVMKEEGDTSVVVLGLCIIAVIVLGCLWDVFVMGG